MKRRIICVVLAVLIMISMLSVGAASVSAASNRTTGNKAIELLKEIEGFSPTRYPDNGGYSIGYGTSCKATDFPNGITESQAETLLRHRLSVMEKSVNAFADKYKLSFTQNQFDALMMFTYNCGAKWTTEESDFRTAVINGNKGNDFIYYFTRWSTDGTNVLPGLAKRRLAEADIYLYGYYSKEAPDNYAYVLFDANGGSSSSKIQGYDASEPVAVKATAEYSGHRFLGWYTAKEGGKWITQLDKTTMGITQLYAHWQKDEGNLDGKGNILGSAAEYERTISGDASMTVRKTPQPNGEAIKKLEKGKVVTIVSDYVDAYGCKWGVMKDGGWINLNGTTVKTVAADKPQRPVEKPEEEKGIQVTVTGNNVNIRKDAGTKNAVVDSAYKGEKLVITETKMVDNMKWGKSSDGWIALMYTTYDQVVMEQEKEETAHIMTGTVVNCGNLRIRYSPSTNSAIMGSLPEGTQVKLLERKTANGGEWGRISNGWISLNYVKLEELNLDNDQDEEESEQIPEETLPVTETTPPAQEGTGSDNKPSESGKLTGTVISHMDLNIRSAPGANNLRVGGYSRGTKIEILEQKKVGDVAWGRTDKGWVCMEYVALDTNIFDDGTGVPGTVICNAYLNVRRSPGVRNALVGTLRTQTRVVVYEQKYIGSDAWGRIDQGWVCMQYIRLDTDPQPPVPSTPPTPTPPPTTLPDSGTTPDTDTAPDTGSTTGITGKVVRTNALCLRSGAGTNNKILDTLKMGTKVTIYQQTIVNGMVWGRTDKGWVSMNYIELDASNNDQVLMTGTVTASALYIRSAAGTGSAVRGTYAQGTRVEILETKTLNGTPWGRTDKGWICMAYVA